MPILDTVRVLSRQELEDLQAYGMCIDQPKEFFYSGGFSRYELFYSFGLITAHTVVSEFPYIHEHISVVML